MGFLENVFTIIWNLIKEETTASELPSNLILVEILPRLPTKLLGRCMCVCKEWKSFLSTPKFAKMHHKYVSAYKLFQIDHSNSSRLLTMHMIDCEAPNVGSNTVRLCNKYSEHLFRSFGVITERNYDSLPYPYNDLTNLYIVASYDGLVCLAAMYTQELAFWNPLTRAFKKLSDNSCSPRFYKPSYTQGPLLYSPDKIGMPPSSSDVIGFYIDSSNDYKLLHMVSNGALGAYVYSLRTDSWRKIEYLLVDISNYHWSPATFWDNHLYFVVLDLAGNERCIICFDVESEKFSKIQFPTIQKYTSSTFTASLVVLDDCIHLCVCYLPSERVSLLEGGTWRMDGNNGWLKVMAFSDVEDDSKVRRLVCMTRNENWLALVAQENDCFEKIDFEDFATSYSCLYNEGWVSNLGQTSTIYNETLVSPYCSPPITVLN